MHNTVPKRPVEQFKRTKIIATYGPSINSYDKLHDLIAGGVNGVRLNFSHGNHEDHGKAIKLVRKVSKNYGKPVAIIQDLQGPKMRLGEFDGIYNVEKNQSIRLRYNADFERENILPTQYDLSKKVKRGERLYFFDGKVKTVITSVKDGIIHLKAENNGYLISKKGINLPDTDFAGDILTTKDKQDLVFGTSQGVDYVALSFVQSAEDVNKLKKQLINLGSHAKVIAKIETRSAVENIESIVESADAVMVARGDLAIETSVEEVPILQRTIIKLGLKYAKPTIVATQMLASMVDSTDPTRAEAGDVATAVLMGADAVMLSEETASGKHPLEAVKVMKKIIKFSENNLHKKTYVKLNDESHTKQTAINKTIINLSYNVGAIAIIPETKSGATAYKIASYRPDLPIIAVTSSIVVAQQLSIVSGVKSFVRKDEHYQASHLTDWLRTNKVLKKGDVVVIASGNRPGVVGATDTIKVRVLE
jgi:pyruvate kinase